MMEKHNVGFVMSSGFQFETEIEVLNTFEDFMNELDMDGYLVVNNTKNNGGTKIDLQSVEVMFSKGSIK